MIAEVFADLVDAPRWVAWRFEGRNGKRTKPPINPATGGYAKSDDPTTWATLEDAEYGRDERGLDGIGFVLNGDGLGGIDLDGCRDPETGEIARWAQVIIDGFRSYTEVSPSGTGVKILAYGAPSALPASKLAMDTPPIDGKDPAIEVFVTGRYFTITGDVLPGCPDEIRDCGEIGDAWDRLVRLLRERSGPRNGDDTELSPGVGLPDRLEAMLAVIPADDYDMWLRVGAALHYGDPEDGLDVWDEWSATSGKYPGRSEIEKKWRTFSHERPAGQKKANIGTLVNIAREHGYTGRAFSDEEWKERQEAGDEGVRYEDFYAYMVSHSYIFAPTRELWPAASVNARIGPYPTGEKKKDGSEEYEAASKKLDRERAVEQLTWAPGEPEVIEGRLIAGGGWIERAGVRVFNQYRPPTIALGDPEQAGPWIEHTHRVFPNEAAHIIRWLAQRVQRPHEKINHAIVLVGPQGTGKDTILEGMLPAVAPWNVWEVSPDMIMGRFHPWKKSVILRISEARDLGDVDRFKFYEHTKTLAAAPPHVLTIDEKHKPEYAVPNVIGAVLTSNHTDGIYLPPDDRRHFVALTELTKEDFTAEYFHQLYTWYENGGHERIAAYLHALDLSDFDTKAPPPKTTGFWQVVDAGRAPEDAELADALDRLQEPSAVTLEDLAHVSVDTFADWLRDRRNSRQVPHRMEEAGYIAVRNDAAKDGRWKVGSRRQVIYARRDLSIRDRIAAAQKRMEAER